MADCSIHGNFKTPCGNLKFATRFAAIFPQFAAVIGTPENRT
jgi:hypothetical protein